MTLENAVSQLAVIIQRLETKAALAEKAGLKRTVQDLTRDATALRVILTALSPVED